jgi:hypothetical protein
VFTSERDFGLPRGFALETPDVVESSAFQSGLAGFGFGFGFGFLRPAGGPARDQKLVIGYKL